MTKKKKNIAMKLSNKILASAGGVICILLLTMVIIARVGFDRMLQYEGPNDSLTYNYTYTYKP